LARKIVDIMADKQSQDIVLLDLRPLTTFTDYFVIGSCTSDRQLRAVAMAVLEQLAGCDVHPLHDEGLADSEWILLDYGSVIAHLFSPAHRAYYRLERIWSDAPLVLRIQ